MKKPAVVWAAVALLGTLAVLWGLGCLVESLVERRLSRRFGAPVDLDLSLGFHAQRVEDIAIGGPELGVDVQVAQVDVEASPWGLLTRGRRGIKAVRVVGVKGVVNTAKLAPLVVPDRGDMDGDEGTSASASKRLPTLQVQGVALQLRDDQGELLGVNCARASAMGERLDVYCSRLRLGDELASVSVEGLRAQAVRNERLQLKTGSVDRIAVAARPQGDSISLVRTKAALAAMRTAWMPRHGRPSTASTGEQAEAKETEGLARLLQLLAPGAELSVHDAKVEVVRGGENEALLSGASIRLGADEGGNVSSEGRGTAIGGGRISWDVVLGNHPFALKGDVEVDSLPLSLLASAVPQVPWYQPEAGRIDARLTLRTTSVGRVAWEGRLSLADVGLSSARLSADPVTGIEFSLTGKGALLPLDRRLEVVEGRLQLGGARMSVSGAAALKDGAYHVAIDADLPTTPCETAVKAIPAGMLGDLSTSELRGAIAGQLHLLVDSAALADTELDIKVKDRCEFVAMPPSLDLRRFRRPFHHVVQESEDEVFEMDTGPGTDAFTYLEDISPFLVHAVIAHEDARFFAHSGFSLLHIRNALVRNLQEGRYVVGASTISMQLVKNILLHREKTLARKLQEVLLTWYMERVMDKSEIIELYLNVIEYGPDVYGIRHASQYYFGRTPAELSPAEAAFFATILPAPKSFHDYYVRGALSHGGQSRLRTLIKRLEARGSYDEVATQFALAEVDNFRFAKAGAPLPSPRADMGQAQPLPYETGFWSEDEWELTTTNRVTGRDLGFGLPR